MTDYTAFEPSEQDIEDFGDLALGAAMAQWSNFESLHDEL